jgi:hypothetical protein
MSKGRYQHHTQEECNKVGKLRKMGLTFAIISQRMGYGVKSLREMNARAQ